LVDTKCFQPLDAIPAVAASRVEPGHTDTVAFLDRLNPPSESGYNPNALVTRDKGQRRFDGPITIDRMQVGFTDTACLDLDKHLARGRLGGGNVFNRKGLTEFIYDGSFHISG
jgi:hypothetical protein